MGRAQMVLGPGLELPIDATTETFGVFGIKGSGKSTTAKLIVEQLTSAGQQTLVVDPVGTWWGLKASADGKKAGLPFTVLGGEHGDLPLNVNAGELVAELAIDSTAPLIVDVSHMRKAEQRRFLLPLIETLYFRNREPLMLVIDEADLFIPQRVQSDMARLVGAVEDVVRRGRQRGLGCTLVTQRPASLNADVRSQVSTLVAHRLTGVHDRRAMDDWVDAQGDREQQAQMMAALAHLHAGEAWVWSPAWLQFFGRVQMNRPVTFDSFATPKPGQRRVEPKALSKVDVAALRARMADLVAEVEANDPKVLRRRVVELERQLAAAAAHGTNSGQVTVERVEVPVADPAVAALLSTLERKVAELGGVARAEMDRVFEALVAVHGEVVKAAAAAAKFTPASGPASAPAARPSRTARTGTTSDAISERLAVSLSRVDDSARRDQRAADRQPGVAAGDVTLKAGARRILDTLARHHPMRTTKAQAGTLTGFKTSGGTWATYIGALRRAGYLTIVDGLFVVTDAGLEAAGADTSSPMTTDEVLDRWRQALKKGARDMLDILVDAYPAQISRSDLAERLSMAETGGTFNTYLGTLRRNGLADVDSGMVCASDSLFLGGRR